MQIIPVLAKYDITLSGINSSFLSKVDGQDVKIALIKNFEPLLQGFLMIAK